MITIDIPGYKKIDVEHLVLDYNGTLAIDGRLISGTFELLEFLSKQLALHVLTADTFGTVANEMKGIDCTLKIIRPSLQDIEKKKYLLNLGSDQTIAIGNGLNDTQMLKEAVLGIAVIQKEGAALKSILNADIICIDIIDALSLLLNPQRIVATLRN